MQRFAPFLVALIVYALALAAMDAPFTGDEPHYALEAFSIVEDGDRDLADDYASLERVQRVADVVTLQPQAYRFSPHGPLSSIHNVGLPLLLAPAAAVGGTVEAMQVELIAIAAIGAQLLFSILALLVPGRARLRWAVWAAIVFSVPLLAYSARLYPEMPAAVIVLAVVRILLATRIGWPAALLASALAAYLPWLHIRFSVVAVALIAALAVRVVQTTGARPGVLTAAVAPFVVGLAVLSVGFASWYDTPSLLAQVRAVDRIADAPSVARESVDPGTEAPESSLADGLDGARAFHGFTRGLFSARNGWMPFAPVGLLAVAAALALAVRGRRWIAAAVAVAALYFLQIALTGVLPGFAPPGRFELVYLPLLAVPLLLVLRDVPWTRVPFWPLAAAGLVISAFAVGHASGLQPAQAGTARADVGAANHLLRPWPTVSREPDRPPRTIALDVCEGRRPVGDLFGCGSDGSVRATPEMGEGYLYRGNAQRLSAGEWVVVSSLMREGPAEGDGARIEVLAGGRRFLSRDVPAAEIPEGELRAVTEEIRVPEGTPIETRVHTYGDVTLTALAPRYSEASDPATGALAEGTLFPDLSRVLLWLGALLGLAAAIAVSLRPRSLERGQPLDVGQSGREEVAVLGDPGQDRVGVEDQ